MNMVAKRVSRRKPTSKASAAASTPELTEATVLQVLESPASDFGIDVELRRRLVATEAYLIAEKRGFSPGHDLDDWVAAEAAVEARLREMRAA
jgi:hypothetical protein